MGNTASGGEKRVRALGSVRIHAPGFKLDFSRHYRSVFLTLFSLSVVLSVSDLLTTAVALRMGLSEANYLLVALASSLGVSTVTALGLTKLAFMTGTFWAAMYGIRTTNRTMRMRALLVLSSLVAVLFFVSLNNAYWILTS